MDSSTAISSGCPLPHFALRPRDLSRDRRGELVQRFTRGDVHRLAVRATEGEVREHVFADRHAAE